MTCEQRIRMDMIAARYKKFWEDGGPAGLTLIPDPSCHYSLFMGVPISDIEKHIAEEAA